MHQGTSVDKTSCLLATPYAWTVLLLEQDTMTRRRALRTTEEGRLRAKERVPQVSLACCPHHQQSDNARPGPTRNSVDGWVSSQAMAEDADKTPRLGEMRTPCHPGRAARREPEETDRPRSSGERDTISTATQISVPYSHPCSSDVQPVTVGGQHGTERVWD